VQTGLRIGNQVAQFLDVAELLVDDLAGGGLVEVQQGGGLLGLLDNYLATRTERLRNHHDPPSSTLRAALCLTPSFRRDAIC